MASKLGLVTVFDAGMDAEPDSPTNVGRRAGPALRGALVAVDLGDDGPDDERRFDFAVTYDRDLVMTAANSLMTRARPIG